MRARDNCSIKEALRDYDMDERLEEKISMVTAKEVAMFKNVNINVRSMHHRQIVIQQAEKLRDGFFLKTKTSVRRINFETSHN